MTLKAVIFDMDGLMLDTEPLYRRTWQAAIAECGFTMSAAEHLPFIGRGFDDCSTLLRAKYGSTFPLETFWSQFKAQGAKIFAGDLPLKPGLLPLLDLLDRRGVPIGVATGTLRANALDWLSRTGLLPRFKAVAGGDEVSFGKPAPDLFLLAASRLGVAAKDCLVLEDSEPGAIGATKAGMRVMIVPDLKQPSAEVAQSIAGVFPSLVEATPLIERELPA